MNEIRSLDDLLGPEGDEAPKRKLLVVDDKPEVVDGIRSSRLSRAYEIVTAGNGREGLARLAADPGIGVVLLDMLMPVMGGEDFLKELWADRERYNPYVRVIVYTAFAGRGVDQAGILEQYGPVRFLTKATDPAVIEAEVRNAYTEHDTERRVHQELAASASAAAFGEIARYVAHDLRSPLALAATDLEFLMKLVEKGEPVRAELLQEARGAVGLTQQRIALVEELAYASVEKVMTDLPTLVGRMLSVYDHKIDKEGFTVETRFDPELQPITASPALVNAALQNLLENSLQFARPGSRQIEIGLFREGEHACVSWKDHGVGINPEHLSRVFEPGWSTRHDAAGRTTGGLGLASVLRAMELHGGSVEVSSEAGRWTSFLLRFPATRPDEITPSGTASPSGAA